MSAVRRLADGLSPPGMSRRRCRRRPSITARCSPSAGSPCSSPGWRWQRFACRPRCAMSSATFAPAIRVERWVTVALWLRGRHFDCDHRRDRLLGAVRVDPVLQKVPITEFLFGLQWSPQTALARRSGGPSGAFGAVPLFAGTLLITLIAMLVAVPIGMFSAIYLSQYASGASAPGPSRSLRSSPASRPWSTASSPR